MEQLLSLPEENYTFHSEVHNEIQIYKFDDDI